MYNKMPYRRPRAFRAPTAARSAYRRRLYRRRRARPTRASRYSAMSRLVSRRLNDGVQWKQTLYGSNVVLRVAGLPAIFESDMYVRDIPKYRNDPTAPARFANLQQARTSDKILLKGFKVNLSVTNFSTETTCIRFIMFRNNSWNESYIIGGTNLIETLDGGTSGPSSLLSTAMTERFNTDLVRNKRRDILFDRKLVVGRNTSDDAKDLARASFYVPCMHICQFESKGDTGGSDDLKTGTYWLVAWVSNVPNTAAGDTSFHYDINAVWAEA